MAAAPRTAMAAGKLSGLTRPDRCAAQRGLTLHELLIVMAIVALLLALSMPSFQLVIERHRINTAAADLYAAVTLTRAEAIRRGASVELAPTDGADWANGWVVASDVSQARGGAGRSSTQIVRVHGPLAKGITITSVMKDSASPYVAYGANGRSRTRKNSQVPQAGHFVLSLGRQQRRIVLNFVGRPRLCNPASDRNCS